MMRHQAPPSGDLYVTGDTHGDKARFLTREAKRLKEGDALVVLGDFGFL